MENATKALLISGGILMGVLVLTLGITLFNSMSAYIESSQETIRFNDLNAFNTQFLKYSNANNVTIQDIVSVANLAKQNNQSYNILTSAQIAASRDNPSVCYVTVYLGTNPIEADIETRTADLLKQYLDDNNFRCTDIKTSDKTGRVYAIYFEKIP